MMQVKIKENILGEKKKEELREEKLLRKELRKHADYKEEITNKQIAELVETHRKNMVKDLHNLDEEMLEKEREKEAEKKRKAEVREQKQIARDEERIRKAIIREEKQKTRKAEQERRKHEKEQLRKTKKRTK